MADTNNIPQLVSQRADPTSTPQVVIPEPSHIPPASDPNLESTISKNFVPDTSISSKPDESLSSAKTMNEDGQG